MKINNSIAYKPPTALELKPTVAVRDDFSAPETQRIRGEALPRDENAYATRLLFDQGSMIAHRLASDWEQTSETDEFPPVPDADAAIEYARGLTGSQDEGGSWSNRCLEMIAAAYRDAGIALPAETAGWTTATEAYDWYQNVGRITSGTPQDATFPPTGAIVFFDTPDGATGAVDGVIDHAGISLGDGRYISTLTGREIPIEAELSNSFNGYVGWAYPNGAPSAVTSDNRNQIPPKFSPFSDFMLTPD